MGNLTGDGMGTRRNREAERTVTGGVPLGTKTEEEELFPQGCCVNAGVRKTGNWNRTA